MARKKNVLPSYLLHAQSGQARVRIDGRDHLLGEYGSEESRIRYGELIARHASGLPIDPVSRSRSERNAQKPPAGPSVGELLLGYWRHADQYYRKPDGTPTSEICCLKSALRPVRELFGMTPAQDFTPLMLKAVRQKYIAAGWTRTNINKNVCRVRSVFRWGTENGLVPESTLSALKALSPLSAGRSEAVEGRTRRAVSDENLQAVRKRLGPRNQDIFDLLLLTGARPGELLSVTWDMIDTTSEVWVVELAQHKNSHKGKSRKLCFGPRAQAILSKYSDIPTTQRIFPSRRDTLSQAIAEACRKAKVPPFVPHELRHTAATRVRDTLGIECAQATLGHATPDMTAHYSSRMDTLAVQTAAAVG